MFIGGMLCESNKRDVLKNIVEAEELVEEMTKPGEDTASQLDDGLSFHEQFQLGRTPGPVSYTHLTLPTILRV